MRLNYCQQENIFQLWHSLQFANNLGDWLEKNFSIKKVRTSNEKINLVYADSISGIFIN